MASLRYFKFDVNEWLNGSISTESYELQGLFVAICAFYWHREGDLPIRLAEKKFKNPVGLQSLLDEGILKVENDALRISFLDTQLQELQRNRQTNRLNGSLGGRPKKTDSVIKSKPNEKRNETKSKGIKNNIYNNSISINNNLNKDISINNTLAHFEKFWNAYDKKLDREKSLKKFLTLSETEIKKILETVEAYVKATPEKKYRKNPLTYLNGKCWNDEIIINETRHEQSKQPAGRGYERRGGSDYD